MPQTEQEQSEALDRVLAQSLPKPGLAETLRYWRLSQPLTATPAPQAESELRTVSG